uniref:Ovule protein n=1 Tax=Steinernema glaseri TaxID=37863 RepID=A0A1I7ZLV6_9BILA
MNQPVENRNYLETLYSSGQQLLLICFPPLPPNPSRSWGTGIWGASHLISFKSWKGRVRNYEVTVKHTTVP